jgi:hypothetical protein
MGWAMSTEESLTDIVRSAYDKARQEHARIPTLTAAEKNEGPIKLMEYIKALVLSGERDPRKICHSALCLMRNYEQINRSKEHLGEQVSTIGDRLALAIIQNPHPSPGDIFP